MRRNFHVKGDVYTFTKGRERLWNGGEGGTPLGAGGEGGGGTFTLTIRGGVGTEGVKELFHQKRVARDKKDSNKCYIERWEGGNGGGGGGKKGGSFLLSYNRNDLRNKGKEE